MKIVSWNVNSVRARIENIKNYIKDSTPDVLLLQEIKTQNENFPNDEFKNLGYSSYGKFSFCVLISCSKRTSGIESLI